MGSFQRVYSDAQRNAIVRAYIDERRGSFSKIVSLAAAGALAEGLEPFELERSSAHAIVRKEKRRRERATRSELATAPARDAIEELRRRLVAQTDRTLQELERGREKPANGEELRQIARAIRELAAIPDAGERTSREAPALHPSSTKGGLAGKIIASSRASAPIDAGARINAEEEPSDMHSPQEERERGEEEESALELGAERERINAAEEETPGGYARAQLDRLRRRNAGAARSAGSSV